MDWLLGMGKWLDVYGEAIYGTRVCAPYKKDGIGFTTKNGVVYAIETFASETQEVPSKVWIPYEGKVTKISDMADGRVLSFEVKDGGYLVDAGEWAEEKAPIGCVFCLENEEK